MKTKYLHKKDVSLGRDLNFKEVNKTLSEVSGELKAELRSRKISRKKQDQTSEK